MIEDNIISTEANEKTVLVGLITQRQSEQKTLEYLDELAFLQNSRSSTRQDVPPETRISESAHLCRFRQAGRDTRICRERRHRHGNF